MRDFLAPWWPAILIVILGLGLLVIASYSEPMPPRDAALDDLYEAMVGDSASLLTEIQSLNLTLQSFCVELSLQRGIHPDHCYE